MPIGPGDYELSVHPKYRWITPGTKVTVVSGRTVQVDLPVYRQRQVTLEWWFRKTESTVWRTGIHRIYTGDYWDPGERLLGDRYLGFKFGIDVWELIALSNRHPRVNILQPGAGVGGHCIAIDPWFIVHAGGEDAKMIRTARDVNTYKTEWVIEKIKNEALKFENKNGRKAKVACMGLAFKPDIDDLRESPALYITRRLIEDGLGILAVEPNIENFNEFDVINYNEAIEKADIVTFLVAHKEFKGLDIKTNLDFCGVLNA